MKLIRYLAAMSSHRTYLMLIILPYLLLVVIFHIQLQLPGGRQATLSQTDPPPSEFNLDIPPLDPSLDNEAFHVRDLMLKEGVNELYIAQNELRKSYGREEGNDGRIDGFEHQVAAPRAENDTSLRIIRVSRTFENGTRQVRDVIRSPDQYSQRLELEVESEQIETGGNGPPKNNYTLKYSRNNIQIPLTEQCFGYFTRDGEISDMYGTFKYIGGVYIVSAYLDARIPDEPPFVRMISLLKRGRKPDLYCHFPYVEEYKNGTSRTVYFTETVLFYEMCENHGKEYGGWIISCKVPSIYSDYDKYPCQVVLSKQYTYGVVVADSVSIPILTTTPQHDMDVKDNLKFAVCVPPLFGHIPSTTLIEFVELSRLLGASHVIFYVYKVTSAIQKVLEYYQEQGLVTIINWDLPVRDNNIWYNGQIIAINDCLYRTMHRFSHVVFNDIDEFLVPHLHNSWHGMLNHLERFGPVAENDTKMCGFTFQSAFFDPLVNDNSKIMYDLESDLRTKIFSTVRTKVMVRPYRIFELGIHHISRPLVDRFANDKVHPRIAFIHHYRKCMTDFDARMKCNVYARDESVSRYVPALRHNVHQTLWILKERDQLGQQSVIG